MEANERGGGGQLSAKQLVDAECERLLRNTKRQVKQMMEEAVTKKFIHEDSSSIISLCVAIEACLSHRLKRRALGLFKTNSTTALVRKIAKLCSEAQATISMVEAEERHQQDEVKRKKKLEANNHQQADQKQQSDQTNSNQRSPARQVAVASNLNVHKRNMWIKCALIEKKLVAIVEHLAESAVRYYEPEALMANRVSAQLLCSLLVGPCALEFSRSKTNDFYQFEEPNADELLKRHKLSNPIVCLCSPNASSRFNSNFNNLNQRHSSSTTPTSCGCRNNSQVSRSLSTSTGGSLAVKSARGQHSQAHSSSSLVRSSTEGRRTRTASQSSFNELDIHEEDEQQQQQRSNKSPLVRKDSSQGGGSGRRRPLALRTNIKTGALVTECHHSFCQEISEHQQTRGYSFTSTINNGSGKKRDQRRESLSAKLWNGQQQQQQPDPFAGCATQLQNGQEAPWSAWSPRMLHETLHQNSKSSLLYAKNNVLLETNAHGTIAGYLSLHQTSSSDLILKWIPNQLINGGGHSQQNDACCCREATRPRALAKKWGKNQQKRLTRNVSKCSLDSASKLTELNNVEGARSSSLSYADELRTDGSCDSQEDGALHQIDSKSAKLRRRQDSLSSSAESCLQSDEPRQHQDESLKHSQAIGSSYLDLVICLSVSRIVLLHCHFNDQPTSEFFGSPANELPDGSGESKMLTNDLEETLILVEADGVQRAPFRFPKGGLRWFLSCLENGLGPDRYLEPAIKPDESGSDPNNNNIGKGNANESSWKSFGRKAAFSMGSDSPSTESEPANSRLEILLRRLPSLRRVAPVSSSLVGPKSHSADLVSATTDDNQSLGDSAPLPRPVDGSSTPPNQQQQQPQRSINYVYRIVSTAHLNQLDWPQETPAPLSALSVDSSSSGSFMLIGANGRLLQKRRQQLSSGESSAGVGQRFSWSLSKLALFSSPLTNSATNSTTSSPAAAIKGEGRCNSPQASDSVSSRSKSTLGSLTSLLYLSYNKTAATLDGVNSIDGQPQPPIRRDSSSELIRIEAKLNDLKVGSNEQLVVLRNQSIRTLCESMRKQILARAFYGWLVYCRRMRIVRTHLMGLLNESRLEALGVKRAKQEAEAEDEAETETEAQEMEEDEEELRRGLTWAHWRQLQSIGDQADGSSKGCSARRKLKLVGRINRLVYFGGIEDNQLRAEVWPYLLGHYKFGDSPKMRRQRDEACREAFEAGARDWTKIERVIKERDSEILAANMAKAARRQRRELKTLDDANPDQQQEQTANGFSSLTSGTSDQDSVDMLREVADEQESGAKRSDGSSRKEQPIEDEVVDENGETNDKRGEEMEDKNEEHEKGDSIASDGQNQQHTKAKSRAIARRQRRMRRRFRLESTGSVGSDASITDQFGNNIHRIDKDVQRCDRNFWYFKETKNLDRLRRIMCSYVWSHLDVGYVQGMCDLAAPILVIFDHDELMAFNCFSQLMKRMVANFPHGSAMDKHFEHLKYLMQVLDPKLFEILQNNGDYTHFYFCYRWLLLDFKRELAYDDVYRVWEAIWSARVVASEHFVVFLALAMVRFYRDIIIENNMDFTDTIKFFNEMAERHDAKKIIALAQDCVSELESLIEIG